MGQYVPIRIAGGDYKRQVAREPYFALQNRYFEQNPALNPNGTAYIARPAMKKWQAVGSGPIRRIYSEPGAFDGDVFVVSGGALYRITTAGVPTLLGTLSGDVAAVCDMVAVAAIGPFYPDKLFIAEGAILEYYTEAAAASSRLEADENPNKGDTFRVASTYYKFADSEELADGAGTEASPYQILIEENKEETLENVYKAINGTGIAGTTYSTSLVTHASAQAVPPGESYIIIGALSTGVGGNSIVVEATSDTWEFTSTTMEGGITAGLYTIPTPDDLGAISVAHINQYIIVVPQQLEGSMGRFFWINPGEIEIDPLSFATAERAPDPINEVRVFSDMFWLCGSTTVEPWITTGDADIPMERFKGVLYDRGTIQGTAIKVKDSLFVVDDNGAVWQIGKGLKRVSRPDVEERLRKAIQDEA